MTAQVMDKIIINGEEHSLAVEPLRPYLETHPDIRFSAPHTACRRGYVATWEIRDDKLLLIEIPEANRSYEGNTSPDDMISALQANKEPVFADWVTGQLRIPKGEALL